MRELDGDTVGALYEAAANPALWPDAWARLLAGFEADTGLIWRQAQPCADACRAMIDWPPVPMRAFVDGCVHLDPLALPGELTGRFGALLGRAVPCGARFGAAEHYVPFARRYIGGAWHTLAEDFAFEAFASCGIALHRPRDASPFTVDDATTLAAVARHVGAALRLERLLIEQRIARAARDSVLDQWTHGAVIVDGDARIVFANLAARALAEAGIINLAAPGLSSHGAGREAERLIELVRSATRGHPGGILRLRGPQGAGVAASVTPLAGQLAGQGAGLALVALRALAPAPEVSSEHLIALFDLTAAEASIVPQLLAGDTAQAIAHTRGVKVATVRDQAARILSKTGAANLRALATMIAGLA